MKITFLKIRPLLLASILAGVAILLLPGLEAYALNAGDMLGGPFGNLAPMVLATIALAIVLFGIGLALRAARPYVVALIVVSAAVLFAGQFFASPIPALDGGEHSYAINKMRAALEIVALLHLIAGVSWVAWRNPEGVATIAGLFVAGLMVTSSVTLVENAPDRPSLNETSSLQQFGALSEDLNVIHIMFDSLQSDMFAQVLEDEPSLRSAFAGFTYYPDHLGYSNWTTVSIPAIQTGHYFFEDHDGTTEALGAIREWVSADSLMTKLSAEGFAVAAMQPGDGLCPEVEWTCTTVTRQAAEIQTSADRLNASQNLPTIADLVLLRYTPTAFKPRIYNGGQLLFSQAPNVLRPVERDIVLSRDFARLLSTEFAVTETRPVYKFIHFFPPHRPFILDANCELEPARSDDWTGYQPQAECAVRLVVDMISRLKRQGVYDNTIIILQSDTGLAVPRDETGSDIPGSSIVDLSQPRLIAYARPTLAIKPLGATGPLVESPLATDHKSTFALLEAASEGRLDLDAGPETRSPRSFVASRSVNAGMLSAAPYEQFEIDGPVADPASWRRLGLLARPGVLFEPPSAVESLTLVLDPETRVVSPGQALTLTANAVGGGSGLEFLFYRRLNPDAFDIIQAWSTDNTLEWTVSAEGQARPCQLDLIVSVRHEVRADNEPVVTDNQELSISGGPDCPA